MRRCILLLSVSMALGIISPQASVSGEKPADAGEKVGPYMNGSYFAGPYNVVFVSVRTNGEFSHKRAESEFLKAVEEVLSPEKRTVKVEDQFTIDMKSDSWGIAGFYNTTSKTYGFSAVRIENRTNSESIDSNGKTSKSDGWVVKHFKLDGDKGPVVSYQYADDDQGGLSVIFHKPKN